MKKHSNFRFFLEYVSILFVTYLVASLFITLIGNCSYREVLSSPGQMGALMLLYWWIPIPRMCDMEEHNKNCPQTF